MDIYKATEGQVWVIGEGQDKYHTDDSDNVICGKRPALILRSTGTNCLVIPFSTNRKKYGRLTGAVEINESIDSYPAIDCAQTISALELDEYKGILKASTYRRILGVFIEYVNGNIQYSSRLSGYIYTNSNAGNKYSINMTTGIVKRSDIDETITEEPETNNDNNDNDNNVVLDKKPTKYKKYSIEDKLFIITHSVDEIHKKFNTTLKSATSVKYRCCNLVKENADLSKYSKNEKNLIAKSTIDEIKQWCDLDDLSIAYLKYLIEEEKRKH